MFLCLQGDSMMYHNSVSGVSGGNGNCSGSPNSTPPNINACSSTTPPLSSGQTSQSDGNDMVLYLINYRVYPLCHYNGSLFQSNQNPNQQQHQQHQQQLQNCQNLAASSTDGDEDVWRGHSIAALRRRASELNASTIPSYLHAHNYEHHNSVY